MNLKLTNWDYLVWETEKEEKNEESLRNLWNTVKILNICIMGVSKGVEREEGTEKMFEAIVA